MIDLPVVSILLPVYNGEKYLAEAVESLLSQTFQAFELIAINDGSQDKSGEILEWYQRQDARILIYHQENQGLIASLNRGLKLARGRYLARMDADDISMPVRLEQQVQFMEQNSSIILTGSAYELIDETGVTIRTDKLPITDTMIRWHLLFHSPFAHSSVIFQMDPCREHGLSYDSQAAHAEDFELWSRMLCYGLAHNFEIPLIKRRIHPEQISKTSWGQHQEATDRVSQLIIEKLGIHPGLDEVNILRHWYYHFPKTLTDADLPCCLLLLQVLSAFNKLPGLDYQEVRQIRGRWVGKILRALPPKLWRKAEQCGIFRSMDRKDIRNIINYTMRRW